MVSTELCASEDLSRIMMTGSKNAASFIPSPGTLTQSLSLPGWSGEEFFEYMRKVRRVGFLLGVSTADEEQAETFHNKPWFKADEKAHGYSGPLHTEPHDLAPISKMILKSMEDQGLPLQPDMFSNGETSHGCGHAPRTGTYPDTGRRRTSTDHPFQFIKVSGVLVRTL